MKIDHLAMYVIDLERTKEFFICYFNALAGKKYHNPRTDFESYFLSFEDGSRLEIMTRPGLAGNKKNPMQCGFIHLAFSVGSKENVDALTHRLRHDGYETVSGPRTTGDGCYESCILGPEDNLIEITV